MTYRIPHTLAASVAALPALAAPAIAVAAPVATAASGANYTGATVRDGYATATVTITVSGGRVIAVNANVAAHYPLSRQLDARAVPILRSEALRAQSVAGVQKVSGASQTSQAFDGSLASAMRAAHLRGA